ncbi:MAG: ribose 5-phosphate isomerase B [Sedimentisphaerales bacterium]|nr:ribose 5-phosphate isomerase B [Sedimentisphaerales bacterium]
MKIAIGCDHRGYEIKEQVKAIINELGHECIDVGANSNEPVDYPDTAYAAAKAVSIKEADRAILACASGIGMSMAANKVTGVRAALCHDELSAQASRGHNDSNVLCLPADQIGESLLRKIVEVWLKTEFLGGRHQRRVNKIEAIEQGKDPREINN